jgi:hypothetical protein
MRKYFFFVLLFIQCNNIKTNLSYNKYTLCDFYKHQNPFYFSLIPYKCEFVNLDTSKYFIISENVNFNESKTHFNIRCISNETKGVIKIYKKSRKNKSFAKPIITIPLIGFKPPLQVLFGKYRTGSAVDFNEFVNGTLSVSIDNSNINHCFQISSFTLVIQNNDSIITIPTKLDSMFYSNENYGNYTFFSKEQLSQIYKIKHEQFVIIKDIIVKFDIPQEIDPVVFIIKRKN